MSIRSVSVSWLSRNIKLIYAFILTISFIFGFLVGAYIAIVQRNVFAPLLYEVMGTQKSIMGSLTNILMAWMLTSTVCTIKRGRLFFGLCFILSIPYGVICASTIVCYGASHWVMSLLILCPGLINWILLLFFWYRYILDSYVDVMQDIIICFSISAFAAVFDLLVISPYTVTLFI